MDDEVANESCGRRSRNEFMVRTLEDWKFTQIVVVGDSGRR